MSNKNIIQFTNDAQNTKTKWTIQAISDANELSPFHRTNAIITNATYIANLGVVVYIVVTFFANLFHTDTPELSGIFTKFDGNPICGLNAILLFALILGHDDYYKRTEKMLLLSDYMGLQWIDFIIKLSLLGATFLQCMQFELFIAICCYGYILTFIRAHYLKIHLDENHPLFKEVNEKWYPHNIIHNKVMLMWTIFYYLLVRTNLIFVLINYTTTQKLDFEYFLDPVIQKVLYMVRIVYILVFDIYWINRVLNKKITKRNNSFKEAYERELETNVEKYYDETADQ